MRSQLRFFAGFVSAGLLVFSGYYGWQHLEPEVDLIVVDEGGSLTSTERQIIKDNVLHVVMNSNEFMMSLSVAATIENLGWTEHVKVWRERERLNIEVDRKKFVAKFSPSEVLTEGGDVVLIPDEQVATSYPTLSDRDQVIKDSVSTIALLRGIADEAGQDISEIRLSEAGWLVTLNTGVEGVLGHRELESRLGRLLRFNRDIVASDATTTDLHVDARYRFGVAVSARVPESDAQQTELIAQQK